MSQHPSSSRVLVFVGSYTQPLGHAPRAHGAGVTVLDVDSTPACAHGLVQAHGDCRTRDTCASMRLGTSSMPSAELGTEGTLSALRFDEEFRTLIDRSFAGTGGTVASYVSLVGTDFVLVSNYGDGSLASFRLRPDGGVDSRVSLLELSGSGPNLERQEGPHAHWVALHPSNGSVYAADLGSDALLQLSLDRSSGQLAIESVTLHDPRLRTAPSRVQSHRRPRLRGVRADVAARRIRRAARRCVGESARAVDAPAGERGRESRR